MTETQGWLARPSVGNCQYSVQLSVFLQTRLCSPGAALHHQRQPFQFALQDRQRATGNFHSAGRVQGGLWGDAVSASHQKNPQEFRRFAGGRHAFLAEVVPQSIEICHRKFLFRHRRPPNTLTSCVEATIAEACAQSTVFSNFLGKNNEPRQGKEISICYGCL